MSPDTEKSREIRLRRQAERRGLKLEKSSRRDPNASDFGTYQLVDAREGWVVAEQLSGHGYGLTLDDIEEWLNARQILMYKVTARMKVRPFPAVSTEQRKRFADAIGALLSRMILPPVVVWEWETEAVITLVSGGENATTAETRAKEIIDRNAAVMAHLYVDSVEVTDIEPLEA